MPLLSPPRKTKMIFHNVHVYTLQVLLLRIAFLILGGQMIRQFDSVIIYTGSITIGLKLSSSKIKWFLFFQGTDPMRNIFFFFTYKVNLNWIVKFFLSKRLSVGFCARKIDWMRHSRSFNRFWMPDG